MKYLEATTGDELVQPLTPWENKKTQQQLHLLRKLRNFIHLTIFYSVTIGRILTCGFATSFGFSGS